MRIAASLSTTIIVDNHTNDTEGEGEKQLQLQGRPYTTRPARLCVWLSNGWTVYAFFDSRSSK